MAAWVHAGPAQQVVLGPGALRRLLELLRAAGARRVLLVTTEGRLASDAGERVRRALGPLLASTFTGVERHVPTQAVQAAHRQARADGVDAVVSLGGGSCADTAKAVCFFAEQEQGIPSTSWLDRPALPHVAIPTTCSPAAPTASFGMVDAATRTAAGGGAPTCAPVAVVWDPVAVAAPSGEVVAAAGLSAVACCVEAVWSPRRTPEAEAVALAGLRRLAGALPLAVDDPGDETVLTSVLEGVALAGRCALATGHGTHHALARLVAARTGAPYGAAGAALLPHTAAFSAEAAPELARRAGEVLGAPDDLPGALASLRDALGQPSTLLDLGALPDDLDAVARRAASSPELRAGPRPVDEDAARALLDQAT